MIHPDPLYVRMKYRSRTWRQDAIPIPKAHNTCVLATYMSTYHGLYLFWTCKKKTKASQLRLTSHGRTVPCTFLLPVTRWLFSDKHITPLYYTSTLSLLLTDCRLWSFDHHYDMPFSILQWNYLHSQLSQHGRYQIISTLSPEDRPLSFLTLSSYRSASS